MASTETTGFADDFANEIADGRHLRRHRNREAVVEALLDLYREGNLAPSSDQITERAGISQRSLFRYFDDLDDLARTAVDKAQVDVLPRAGVAVDSHAPLAERALAIARTRVELFDDVAAIAQVMRLRAPFQAVVAERLTSARSYLRTQTRKLFASELAAMDGAEADRVLAVADVMTSYESFRLLRDDQGLSPDTAARAVSEALIKIFEPGVTP